MNKQLTELQKIDCKTAPYETRIYRKARRVSQSYTRVLGADGAGAEGQEHAYHVMSSPWTNRFSCLFMYVFLLRFCHQWQKKAKRKRALRQHL